LQLFLLFLMLLLLLQLHLLRLQLLWLLESLNVPVAIIAVSKLIWRARRSSLVRWNIVLLCERIILRNFNCFHIDWRLIQWRFSDYCVFLILNNTRIRGWLGNRQITLRNWRTRLIRIDNVYRRTTLLRCGIIMRKWSQSTRIIVIPSKSILHVARHIITVNLWDISSWIALNSRFIFVGEIISIHWIYRWVVAVSFELECLLLY